MNLTKDHKRWALARHRSKRLHGYSVKFWEDLIVQQGGRCLLTDVPLFFDTAHGTSRKGGRGVHPLYASADHIHPGQDRGFQIVCYALNDLKGHLPVPLFRALEKTFAWKKFKASWKAASARSRKEREEFEGLIRRGY